jgi:putative acetyltransferase
MSVEIREEAGGDQAGIRFVHEQAFAGTAEASLVDRLRADHDLVLSLVAAEDRLLGHVALSRLTMPESQVRAVALAPVGVLPGAQRRGIGTALVAEALRKLAAARFDWVLVLGEPAYYGRFGFTAAAGLAAPYDGPYLQALALSEAGRSARGRVIYAPAFVDLA